MAITQIEAQEQLVLATTLSVPYMKKADREKWKAQMNKAAYPNMKKQALTLEDLVNRGLAKHVQQDQDRNRTGSGQAPGPTKDG